MRTPDEPLLSERSKPGLRAVRLPEADVPRTDLEAAIPEKLRRKAPPALPEVTEVDLARHYTRLSQKNFSVDTHFYPLGSCTMKYNPKVNEDFVRDPVVRRVHPYQPEISIRPLLGMLHATQRMLEELSGFPAVSLQPAAGAHGELTCLMLFKAWHRDHGGEGRTEILIPDSAHGTNPASVVLCGFKPVELASDERGLVNLADLRVAVGEKTAGMMITNPNTLGLFEEEIVEIARVLHDAGALLFMDGANFNAILGRARPHDFGVDAMHMNLHKTFAVPHGGGGPGSGPIGVSAELEPYLPRPVLVADEDGDGYRLDYAREKSIGRVRGFFGSTGAILRSYCYLRVLGQEGVRRVTDMAVLNANYLRKLVGKHLRIPYDRICLHEFVASLDSLPEFGPRPAMLAAKRLLDLGIHPPTTYFPLIVPECWMVEPTETESMETMEEFAEAVAQIVREASEEPQKLLEAPRHMPVTRLDEVRANREPRLTWSG
ncbi:MAG: aminomethyl-transferring glycine dehydrogenase subunit GcvPB [Planctomycetota bacterium]